MHPNDLETTRWCLFFNRLILGHKVCNNHGHFCSFSKMYFVSQSFSLPDYCVAKPSMLKNHLSWFLSGLELRWCGESLYIEHQLMLLLFGICKKCFL